MTSGIQVASPHSHTHSAFSGIMTESQELYNGSPSEPLPAAGQDVTHLELTRAQSVPLDMQISNMQAQKFVALIRNTIQKPKPETALGLLQKHSFSADYKSEKFCDTNKIAVYFFGKTESRDAFMSYAKETIKLRGFVSVSSVSSYPEKSYGAMVKIDKPADYFQLRSTFQAVLESNSHKFGEETKACQ